MTAALALLLGSALAVGVGANADDSRTPLELAALMQRMSASAGVVAEFREQKQLALLSLPLESSGVLYFAPPGRLARFTEQPSASSLIIDGETLHFRDGPGGEELDLSGNPMARVFVDNFIVLFNGDLNGLQDLYRTELCGTAEAWTLELVPRRPPLSRVMAKITLRGGEMGIASMDMLASDGDRTTTALDNVDSDRRFSEAELETLFSDRVPLARAAARR